MPKSLKARVKAVSAVLGAIAWRSFGGFLFILGASAGTGAFFVGSWSTGVLIAWGTMVLGIIGAVGYAIAVTGKVTPEDVAKASQDAVQKAADKAAK